MTTEPITTANHSSVLKAAQLMRDANVGSVIVTDHDDICGILTDRDVVVRGVAEGMIPSSSRWQISAARSSPRSHPVTVWRTPSRS